MNHVIGIDLGTTYSAMAYLNGLGQPEIIPNRDGETTTPSVVQFQDDVPLVGTIAKSSAADAPEDTVELVKRHMGTSAWRFDASDGTSYRAEAVSAIILKRLREDAEEALGGVVDDAVITVPAYFDDGARRATRDAGELAGLRVHRLINEPTAAALAYGLGNEAAGKVLVYDLGGGTFDVTIMNIDGGRFETIATGGDRNLGGFDWDNVLMQLLHERFRAEGGPDLLEDMASLADLRDKAERAKRALTTTKQTRVKLAAAGVARTIGVTRDEFEAATEALLSRTYDFVETVLDEAGLGWPRVDKILLVGGSTRMPAVRQMLEQAASKPAERGINPDEVVAHGAAVQAGLVAAERSDASTEVGPALLPVQIRDVTSHGLGVIALNPESGVDENTIIIPANTPIPAEHSEGFRTVVNQQESVQLRVTQGDETDPRYVKEIGTTELAIPPYPQGAPILITYAYDVDQTVHVEVSDLTAGQSLGRFTVENTETMPAEEKQAAQAHIDELEVG